MLQGITKKNLTLKQSKMTKYANMSQFTYVNISIVNYLVILVLITP